MSSDNGSILSNDNSIGNFAFNSPENVVSSDGNQASATAILTLLSGNTNYLQVSGYGFAIPPVAAICGIRVEVEKSATGINRFAWVKDNSVRLVRIRKYHRRQ